MLWRPRTALSPGKSLTRQHFKSGIGFVQLTIASINSQCPVSTQMHTTVIAIVKLSNSAAVKRPQQPKDIRWPSVHGRMMYWHIGRSRNARATVAMTVERKEVNWATGQRSAKLTCCAYGEKHLHRVEEEEHYEEWDWGAKRQAKCMRRIERRKSGI